MNPQEQDRIATALTHFTGRLEEAKKVADKYMTDITFAVDPKNANCVIISAMVGGITVTRQLAFVNCANTRYQVEWSDHVIQKYINDKDFWLAMCLLAKAAEAFFPLNRSYKI